MTLPLLVAVLLSFAGGMAGENMNGDYTIANPNTLSPTPFSSTYTDSYFEVYSPPIQTRYSQVFWTMLGPVPLPEDIVTQFDGKVLAITGYEVNQVRVAPDGTETPVPIYEAYNHHFEAYFNGKYSSLTKVPATHTSGHASQSRRPLSTMGHHGGGDAWVFRPVGDDPNPGSDIPASQWFSEGNGGEFRKSYHGYPRGYAQLIDSPVSFSLQPMQIDTHNRDYNGTGFRPGPLPRASTAPADATYSGLIECPCTTRIQKTFVIDYQTQTQGACAKAVMNASECFDAATKVGLPAGTVTRNASTSDPTLPSGCVLVPDSSTDGGLVAIFNADASSSIPCGSSGRPAHVSGSTSSLVGLSVDLNANTSLATITISGPADVWYGVGFNASQMADLPYTIVVNGTGGVMEVSLANHAPGQVLAPSVTVVSNVVKNGTRTVVLTRALKGLTPEHYTFDPTVTNIPFINAIGDTTYFAYHIQRAGATLKLLSQNAATCICNAGEQGFINGLPFSKDCAPEPISDLLQQHNPTCFVETYQGGLFCCHHEWFLLDADQEPPEGVDEYQLKFRIYYQAYDPNYHKNLVRLFWATESYTNEYDVIQCPPGTPPTQCVQTITSHFTVADMLINCSTRHDPTCTGINKTAIQLIYAGGHCHAPSCLSMELYNADTGDLLCRQVPVFGTSDEVFDEKGYLSVPPCLWGSVEEGLQPPITLTADTNLLAIKRNNNTYTHYGEMALWQMRGITF